MPGLLSQFTGELSLARELDIKLARALGEARPEAGGPLSLRLVYFKQVQKPAGTQVTDYLLQAQYANRTTELVRPLIEVTEETKNPPTVSVASGDVDAVIDGGLAGVSVVREFVSQKIQGVKYKGYFWAIKYKTKPGAASGARVTLRPLWAYFLDSEYEVVIGTPGPIVPDRIIASDESVPGATFVFDRFAVHWTDGHEDLETVLYDNEIDPIQYQSPGPIAISGSPGTIVSAAWALISSPRFFWVMDVVVEPGAIPGSIAYLDTTIRYKFGAVDIEIPDVRATVQIIEGPYIT
jgi:hypothetical protein